jgi:hypothetical protein
MQLRDRAAQSVDLSSPPWNWPSRSACARRGWPARRPRSVQHDSSTYPRPGHHSEPPGVPAASRFLTACADAQMPETTRLAATVERWWPEIEASLVFVDETRQVALNVQISPGVGTCGTLGPEPPPVPCPPRLKASPPCGRLAACTRSSRPAAWLGRGVAPPYPRSVCWRSCVGDLPPRDAAQWEACSVTRAPRLHLIAAVPPLHSCA